MVAPLGLDLCLGRDSTAYFSLRSAWVLTSVDVELISMSFRVLMALSTLRFRPLDTDNNVSYPILTLLLPNLKYEHLGKNGQGVYSTHSSLSRVDGFKGEQKRFLVPSSPSQLWGGNGVYLGGLSVHFHMPRYDSLPPMQNQNGGRSIMTRSTVSLNK